MVGKERKYMYAPEQVPRIKNVINNDFIGADEIGAFTKLPSNTTRVSLANSATKCKIPKKRARSNCDNYVLPLEN